MGVFNFMEMINLSKKVKEQKIIISNLLAQIKFQEIEIKKFNEEIKQMLVRGK
tara:strand:- start:2868 stop:3026 length:159 start_codon:yes stop_codon:yes gene_type:complete